MDIDKWLETVKLGNSAAEIIKSKDVTVEELVELDDDDLKSFAVDLGLDTLSKNRFIKSIRLIRQKEAKQNMKTQQPPKRAVIVSSEESEAMLKLYETYNQTSSLCESIQKAMEIINKSCEDNIDNHELNLDSLIIDQVDDIINKLKNKQKVLLTEIDTITQNKINVLNEQLNSMNNYLPIVNSGTKKYEQYMKQKNLDRKERKILIKNMAHSILNKNDISMALRTTPKVQFDTEQYNKHLQETMDSALELNDCDEPKQMKLILEKVDDAQVTVTYQLHEADIKSPKKILEIEAEYAVIPKSEVQLKKIKKKVEKKRDKKKKKKKKKKKRRKRYESSSEDSDDQKTKRSLGEDSTDSSSQNSDDSDDSDDSGSDFNSDDEEEEYVIDSNIDDIDVDQLKWKRYKNSIRFHRKKQKKNKFVIEDLKQQRVYFIRIRARNESGFGPYSEKVVVVTQMCKKILKWSKQFFSRDGFTFSDGRRVANRTTTGHKYILADCKPVTRGKHCWRIKIDNNKHWIMFGVSEQRTFKDGSYSDGAFGHSGSTNQFYGTAMNNHINTSHFHQCKEVDILLDLNKLKMNICEVGQCNEAKEVKYWNMPKGKQWVPHFNVHGQGIQLRIAKISVTWYGKPKSNIFK